MLERGVMARVQVHDSFNVLRPFNAGRILRASHDKLAASQPACRRAEQLVDFGLAVQRVCAHVTQVACEPRIR